MTSRAHYYVVYDGEWKIQCDGENSEPYPRRSDAFKDAVALAHLDFRFAEDSWRDRRPKLAAWHARFAERPSMRATTPEDVY